VLNQSVVYNDGVVLYPGSVTETLAHFPESAVAWLDFVDPTPQELDQLKVAFDLHDLAIRDVLQDRQRPKIEVYDTTHFIVLRPARILGNRLQTVEFYLFVGANFVITARHDNFPNLGSAAQWLTEHPHLAVNSQQIQQVILETICHSYRPVMSFLRDAIDDVEEDIILGEEQAPHRVYELLRDIMKLQRSAHPFPDIINDLRDGLTGELDTHMRSLEDRALRLSGQVDGYRDALTAGLQLHTALLGQRQNEQMTRMTQAAYDQGEQAKKVSAWAAILFTPTVIAGIYGMNFRHMPGLTEWYGFAVSLLAMLVSSVTLYIIFKRQHWL
jgi:magnesium transporter